MRLNNYISSTGLCSRREADKLIEQGRVTVNGKKAQVGQTVEEGAMVKVNNKLIKPKNNNVYIALNKPVGITCTTERHVKGNIIDYVNYPERIFPIGRLDKDSQGLIILTNDGDLANEVLDYLDYEFIAKNPKPIFGYSDLTTVLNSVYSQTNNSVYLYQIRNLIYSDSKNQLTNFSNSLLTDTNDLFNFSYKFIQGESLSGITVGGNIRCLLKLAETKYMPDFTDKILFLESMGGEAALMSAFFNQLKQMGVFSKVRGILLGTFTKMQENNISPTIEELLVKVIDNPNLPIAKTEDIGHGSTSKCLIIGKNIILN